MLSHLNGVCLLSTYFCCSTKFEAFQCLEQVYATLMSIEIVVVLFSRGGGCKLQNGISLLEDITFVIFVINHSLCKTILWFWHVVNDFFHSFWSQFPSKQLNNMIPFSEHTLWSGNCYLQMFLSSIPVGSAGSFTQGSCFCMGTNTFSCGRTLAKFEQWCL